MAKTQKKSAVAAMLHNRNSLRGRWWDDPDYVSIMRPGPYGNPFVIGRDGTRDECVDKYEKWIWAPEQLELLMQIRQELSGKKLVCCCRPRRCHGDVILAILAGRQSRAERKAAQLAAIEVVKATAGVGECYNIYLKAGPGEVARIYLGAVRGTKEVAKASARKSFPKFRGRMVIKRNRNFPTGA